MWGSYGSYSSMSSVSLSAPMDIPSSSLRIHDAVESHCALPSWPRRSSLSSDSDERPSLYLSDDDLFPTDPFEDDAHSVSSGSSSGFLSPAVSPPARLPDADLLRDMEREAKVLAKQHHQAERERRLRQQQMMQQMMAPKKKPRKSSSSKKSPKPMAPIAE